MRGVIVAVAVLVCGCTGDRITNVYGAAQGGDAATGGGGESASGGGGSGSAGGSGGLGGEGSGGANGGGGSGGGCEPTTCAAAFACGQIPDGCGGLLDCPETDCGFATNQWIGCGPDNVCVCTDASSVGDAKAVCATTAAKDWCGDTCAPMFCGDPPQQYAPLGCKPIDLANPGGPMTWCCITGA